MTETKPAKMPWNQNYGEIKWDFLDRAALKGLTEHEALVIHKRWTSIGKKVAKGRY